MLRLLRITGILFFAVLIGITASRLQDLYEAGTLFERYNSQRKADITLLIVSTLGVGILGFFEFIRTRLRLERHGYGSEKKDKEAVSEGLDTTNIYSAPETIEDWRGRRTRASKSRHRQRMDPAAFWMGLLQVYCVILPVAYLCMLIVYLLSWLPRGTGHLALSILLPVLLLSSLLTSFGLLKKKLWGMYFGYAIAIFHLLIFPVGTVAGVLFLVVLVGVTSEFAIPSRERRRQALRKAKRKMASVVV